MSILPSGSCLLGWKTKSNEAAHLLCNQMTRILFILRKPFTFEISHFLTSKKSYQNPHFTNPNFIHFTNGYFSCLSLVLTPKSQAPVFLFYMVASNFLFFFFFFDHFEMLQGAKIHKIKLNKLNRN